MEFEELKGIKVLEESELLEMYERLEQETYKKYREVGELLKSGKDAEAREIIYGFSNQGLFDLTTQTYNRAFSKANVLQNFYEQFTNLEELYRTIIDVYIMDGYNFQKRIMLRAKKIKPKRRFDSDFWDDDSVLDGLPNDDCIVVYRATTNPIEKVHLDLSWTTSKEVAEWFKNRHENVFKMGHMNLYRATIKRDKIIAYNNSRNEFEVIQHNDVKNIELIG